MQNDLNDLTNYMLQGTVTTRWRVCAWFGRLNQPAHLHVQTSHSRLPTLLRIAKELQDANAESRSQSSANLARHPGFGTTLPGQ